MFESILSACTTVAAFIALLSNYKTIRMLWRQHKEQRWLNQWLDEPYPEYEYGG